MVSVRIRDGVGVAVSIEKKEESVGIVGNKQNCFSSVFESGGKLKRKGKEGMKSKIDD